MARRLRSPLSAILALLLLVSACAPARHRPRRPRRCRPRRSRDQARRSRQADRGAKAAAAAGRRPPAGRDQASRADQAGCRRGDRVARPAGDRQPRASQARPRRRAQGRPGHRRRQGGRQELQPVGLGGRPAGAARAWRRGQVHRDDRSEGLRQEHRPVRAGQLRRHRDGRLRDRRRRPRRPPTSTRTSSSSAWTSSRQKPADNLAGLIFDEDKAGYLAGALAGLLTKSARSAPVLGTDLVPPVVKFGKGYEAGAKAVKPDIKVLMAYHPGGLARGFTDPEWGKATTHPDDPAAGRRDLRRWRQHRQRRAARRR